MTASFFTRFLDRSFDWFSTSGLWVLLIAAVMLVLLALLKRGVVRLRSLYKGTLPSPIQIKRAQEMSRGLPLLLSAS
jgi:hypothetical protein